MFQKINCLLVLTLLINSCATTQTTKKIEKSIAVEYGFEGIASDDLVGQTMFGKQHIAVYADAEYFVVRNIATDPEPKTMGALLVTAIKEIKTGNVYTCMTVGDQKLRVLEPADDQRMNEMFSDINDPGYTFTQSAGETFDINGFSCQKWHLAQEGMVSPYIYLTPAIEPADALKQMPIFLHREGKYYGIYMGKDNEFSDKTYKLRAQKIEIDDIQPVAMTLASYKDTNKDEANTAIKAYLGW